MRIHCLLFIVLLLTTLQATSSNYTLKTVVIDAGHGGKDPGAIGPGNTYEKNIALAVALKLGEDIKKNYPNVNVIFTRKTDVFLELHERAEIANQKNADLFISIHCNSNPNPQAYGSSCYVLGLHRTEANLEVAKRENSVILLEDNRDKNYEFDPNSPEGHIIMSMKQNAFLDQSISFASKVEDDMENSANRKSRGVKQAGFYVLYKTTMPGVLAEIGFVSNPDEAKYLKTEEGQNKIADALTQAFGQYKKEIEKSESEQITFAEAKNAEVKSTSDSEVIKATETISKDTPATAPIVEVKKDTIKTSAATNNTIAKTNNTPKETAKVNNDDYFTLTNGSKIKKPVGSESGGGKATVTVTNKPETKTNEVTAKAPVENKTEVNKPSAQPPSKTTNTETTTKPTPEKTVLSNVVFKIQLFALRGELKGKDKLIQLFGSVSEEPLPNGLTRYYGGQVNKYSSAQKLLETAKSNGYPSAFIVGYLNGKRMSYDQLKDYMK